MISRTRIVRIARSEPERLARPSMILNANARPRLSPDLFRGSVSESAITRLILNNFDLRGEEIREIQVESEIDSAVYVNYRGQQFPMRGALSTAGIPDDNNDRSRITDFIPDDRDEISPRYASQATGSASLMRVLPRRRLIGGTTLLLTVK